MKTKTKGDQNEEPPDYEDQFFGAPETFQAPCPPHCAGNCDACMDDDFWISNGDWDYSLKGALLW